MNNFTGSLGVVTEMATAMTTLMTAETSNENDNDNFGNMNISHSDSQIVNSLTKFIFCPWHFQQTKGLVLFPFWSHQLTTGQRNFEHPSSCVV